MSTLIFRLNNVDADEAEEVRQLLVDHELDFYETTAGRWGLSVAGIWLQDDSRAELARELLRDYATQRQLEVRAQYQQGRKRGEIPSLAQRIARAPLRYLAIAVLAAAIIYLSISPFIDMGS